MKDVILLENCSDDIKLWYLATVGKFIVDSDNDDCGIDRDSFDDISLNEVEYEQEQVDEDITEYIPDDDSNSSQLTGQNALLLFKLAVLIKYPLSSDDIEQFFSQNFFEEKLEELKQNPTVVKFLKENEDLVYTSLLKDFIQINFEGKAFAYKFLDHDTFSNFIYSKDYFEQRHMLIDENPVLLEFIETEGFDLEFARFFELGYSLFKVHLLYDGTNKEMQKDLECFNDIFLSDDEKEVSNSFYFSGTPYGIPAKDYVAMFGQALKLVGRAKTVMSTATAIATLSNPLTCALGLTSLGIATVSYLSKNDSLEKNSIRRSLLSSAMENLNQVKIKVQNALEHVTPYFYNKENLIDAGVYETLCSAESFCAVIDQISKSEIELREAYICCELPDILDVKRLDACLRQFENHEETREFILSMYDIEDDEGNKCLTSSSFSRLVRLKNLFDSIGYFTMTGYLKKFI